MKMYIPLAQPFFDKREYERVCGTLNTRMVSSGKVVEEFEETVRRYIGAKHAIAVSSCAAGLFLVLRHVTKNWGMIWVTSPFTFPAVQCVRDVLDYDGSPRIDHIEVDRHSYNMIMREEWASRYSEKHVIIPIHQFGLPCDMDVIRKIAEESRAEVIEDAACALGSTYKDERIGRRGTAIFSFHGRKIITTGEGGIVVTESDEIAEAVLKGRQYGKDKSGKFVGTGLNFKMSDVSATIGCAQMEKIDKILRKRAYIASLYDELLLASEKGITRPSFYNYLHTDTKTNWQSYVIGGVQNRNEVITKMKTTGIECQVGSYDNSKGSCPVSVELSKTTLALPIWPEMTKEMVEFVVEKLEECI